jgi:predicted permease
MWLVFYIVQQHFSKFVRNVTRMAFKADVLLHPHKQKRNMLCSSLSGIIFSMSYTILITLLVNILNYGRFPAADDHLLTATVHIMKLGAESW